jgi:hypothetical protein
MVKANAIVQIATISSSVIALSFFIVVPQP